MDFVIVILTLQKSFEFFLNNTNLTFLAFSYKTDNRASNQQKK